MTVIPRRQTVAGRGIAHGHPSVGAFRAGRPNGPRNCDRGFDVLRQRP
jgi:hypothetical protein